MSKIRFCFITLCIIFSTGSYTYAADKVWGGGGDETSWSDDDNWSPAAEPTSADDALIDAEDASVVCAQTFAAKTVTLGGRENTSLTTNNFVFGTIAPDTSSDVAILNRGGGTLTLTGAGVITVHGKYQDSEESLVNEPSFMFWIE
jgi:hypothetical protein